jgi:hypothetical protein
MICGRKHYYRPTPVKLRKLGDALLAVFGFGGVLIASLTAIFSPTSLAVTIPALVLACVGIVGKFLTNFYAIDTTRESR